jgi:hypothetical protein
MHDPATRVGGIRIACISGLRVYVYVCETKLSVCLQSLLHRCSGFELVACCTQGTQGCVCRRLQALPGQSHLRVLRHACSAPQKNAPQSAKPAALFPPQPARSGPPWGGDGWVQVRFVSHCGRLRSFTQASKAVISMRTYSMPACITACLPMRALRHCLPLFKWVSHQLQDGWEERADGRHHR